jgi:hypothetical protein
MTHNTMVLIAETFPTTKWAVHTSKNYVSSFEALQAFEDDDVVRAVRKLRTLLARNTLSVEELIIEIRRGAKQQRKIKQPESMDKAIAESDQQYMRTQLQREQVDRIRKAVTICRESRAIDNTPLSPRIEEWSGLTIGLVHAALERIDGKY